MIVFAISVIGILQTIGPIIAAIITLGVAVFVHEWGHFMAGRRSGIHAEAFSVGFGPILWRKTVGETEYRLSLILFGGYVKFAGMEGTEDKTPQQIERGFYAVSPARRIFTSFAGPFMNAVLALALFFVLWGTGRKVPEYEATTVIGGVLEGLPAEKAGLRPGDRIVSISGRETRWWLHVMFGTALGDRTLDIEFEREGVLQHVTLESEKDPEHNVWRIGVEPAHQTMVLEVTEGSEAERMGMQQDDLLLTLNGEKIYNAFSWPRELPKHAGRPIEITAERDGAVVTLTGTMPAAKDGNRSTLGFHYGMAPVFVTIWETPLEAVSNCFYIVGGTLKGLMTGRVQAKQLAGPVGIVSIIRARLSVSFTSFLWWAAFISLNLAIVNLLPIPVVDGGHIVFSIIEAVRRKPTREKTMAIITNVFFVLIVGFFLYVTFNDIKRTFFPAGGKDKAPVPEKTTDDPTGPVPETPVPEKVPAEEGPLVPRSELP